MIIRLAVHQNASECGIELRKKLSLIQFSTIESQQHKETKDSSNICKVLWSRTEHSRVASRLTTVKHPPSTMLLLILIILFQAQAIIAVYLD
jgi:hypothetical protein